MACAVWLASTSSVRTSSSSNYARDLLPTRLEQVRLVDIVGLDVEADGGTHVASTALIRGIEIVKIENKGKGFRRLRLRLPA